MEGGEIAKALSNAIVNSNVRQVSGRKKAKTHCSIAILKVPSPSFIEKAINDEQKNKGDREGHRRKKESGREGEAL